jgi:hypothetical protein
MMQEKRTPLGHLLLHTLYFLPAYSSLPVTVFPMGVEGSGLTAFLSGPETHSIRSL